MDKEYIESWKNKEASVRQLELNKKELSNTNNYPDHWKFFLKFVLDQKDIIKSVLDIGCGVGAYYKLCLDNNLGVKYTGIDYSASAIEMAKNHWKYDQFFEMDLWDLTSDYLKQFDLIHLGALLDVLPNGDEALEFLLSLNAERILISRMLIGKTPSEYTTYTAYDIIPTYSYKHNQKNLIILFEKYNYEFDFLKNNVFLYKK